MTKLQHLCSEYGQSPWLDNLTRGYLRDATLARMVGDGIRGVTANPTIFAKAIAGSADYDEQFSLLLAERWGHLVRHGAHCRRRLWASTSTKNAGYPDTLYVDSLFGPDTVTTPPEATIRHFEDHGKLARTVDTDVDEAHDAMRRLGALGVDMDDVGLTLENKAWPASTSPSEKFSSAHATAIHPAAAERD